MRALRIAAAALCCAAIAPAFAEAAGTVTVSVSGDRANVSYTAAAGVANDMTVTSGPGTVTFTDAADLINESELICSGGGTNTVTCTNGAAAPAVEFVRVDVGDLADRLTSSGPLQTAAFGDAGDDVITGTNASPAATELGVSVYGGGGSDTITTGEGSDGAEGGLGTDVISLGPGDDYGEGNQGDGDTVDFGPGDDSGFTEAVDGSGDSLNGGPGLDTLDVGPGVFPPPPIDLQLDLAAGRLFGTGTGAHTVTGFEDADLYGHTTTTIAGTPAANSISTRQGADTVNPGAGSDFLDLGEGADRALLRDGFADYVRCGGGVDSAELDQLDTAVDCESVAVAGVRPAGADTVAPVCRIASLGARVRRRALLARGLRPVVTCDGPASLEVRLLARARRRGGGVRIARSGDVVLAERTLPLSASSRRVTLRVAKRLRTALPSSTRLRVEMLARDEFGNAQTLVLKVALGKPGEIGS